jgi:hypothetical protein
VRERKLSECVPQFAAWVAELKTAGQNYSQGRAGHHTKLAQARDSAGEGPARDGNPHPALNDEWMGHESIISAAKQCVLCPDHREIFPF